MEDGGLIAGWDQGGFPPSVSANILVYSVASHSGQVRGVVTAAQWRANCLSNVVHTLRSLKHKKWCRLTQGPKGRYFRS
jgi:hypothetical protein